MWGKRSAAFRYTLYGALFGFAFPIFSTFGDLYVQQLPLTLESLLQVQKSTPLHWVIDTAPFFLGLFASFAGRRQDQLIRLNERLDQQVQERDQAIDQLQTLQASLEQRSTQLETAAQVGREAAAIRDVVRLLDTTVRLISEQFGFYHAGIFLVDEGGEYAMLQAASSEGGQRMLAQGCKLKVGEVGIVGYVAGSGHPRIALDVGEEAVFFDNPDLPEARSEMALPLRAWGEIIGVLDVQSMEPEAFSEEDVAVLQTLADQVALAVSNARLLQQAQESLEAERRAYGELSREAWAQMVRTRPELGERYDPQGILPTDGRWRGEMKRAVRRGETVLSEERPSVTLATPIKVRGQVIGVLDAHKPGDASEWTAEEIALLETLAEQLGVALESARLYQDTQRRAGRERLTSEVTARVRESLDMETVLKTAVQEVRQALGLPEVVIRLTTSPPSPRTRGDGRSGNEPARSDGQERIV
jgi:GAF domain-containing protein